jgi:NitT/TauT family transport system ATP-binding protein
MTALASSTADDAASGPSSSAVLDAPPAARVELRTVGKTYRGRNGDVAALESISLTVAPGSLVAVVGRSGCGKSTLLRILAGLVTPSAGAALLDDAAIDEPPDSVRYVFQDYASSLLPWKTIEENVTFGLRHAYGTRVRGRRERAAESRRLLALVGLDHAADRYPWELSGGMQQRVAIARALAARPRLLLMDEPFSSVDALSRAQLQDMLLSVWQQLGTTIVLVTHDIEEAVYLADRVVVLAPGGAGILADVENPVPRPREQIASREHPDYLATRRELLRRVLD